MPIAFAILKTIAGEDTTILQYDEDMITERLPKLALQCLPLQSVLKRKYSREEVEKAVSSAWSILIKEFKQETLKIR